MSVSVNYEYSKSHTMFYKKHVIVYYNNVYQFSYCFKYCYTINIYFKQLRPWIIIHPNTFVCPCELTIAGTYPNFNGDHAIFTIHNIYRLWRDLSIFTEVRTQTGGQMNKSKQYISLFKKLLQRYWNHNFIYWNILEIT